MIPQSKKQWSFCETPTEKCTMNHCDENGCQNRMRVLVDREEDVNSNAACCEQQECEGCGEIFPLHTMRSNNEEGWWICEKCISELKS